MSLPPDYHMHTPLCRHARGEPEEYARHALAIGLTEIGFSDHSPMMRDDFDAWRMRLDQLDEYVEKVRSVHGIFHNSRRASLRDLERHNRARSYFYSVTRYVVVAKAR